MAEDDVGEDADLSNNSTNAEEAGGSTSANDDDDEGVLILMHGKADIFSHNEDEQGDSEHGIYLRHNVAEDMAKLAELASDSEINKG